MHDDLLDLRGIQLVTAERPAFVPVMPTASGMETDPGAIGEDEGSAAEA